MNTKRLFLTGFVVWLFSTILGFLTCGWLFRWVYEIPPNIWLPQEAFYEINTLVGGALTGFVAAILFVLVYAVVKKGVPGKGYKKGMYYGLLVWLVGPLPGMSVMPFFMTISTAIIVYWIIQMLILNVINGMITVKLYKE